MKLSLFFIGGETGNRDAPGEKLLERSSPPGPPTQELSAHYRGRVIKSILFLLPL